MGRWILVLLIGLTLNLIVRTHQDVVGRELGSGGDDDDDELSGDDGSTDRDFYEETPCQRQRAASSSRVPGPFYLQCTRDGEFKPVQCNDRECWCVDKDGREKPNSRQPLSNKPPKCTTAGTDVVVVTRNPHGGLPSDPRLKTRPPPLGYTDDTDIVYEDPSTPKPFTPEKTTERKTSKLQTTTSAFQDDDDSDDNPNVQKPGMFAFIFKDPLILAGIIGGAVLALLCIVLLIMFTIYRMRKKDEGSYALDEPKKSYGFAYTRARDQEFFA